MEVAKEALRLAAKNYLSLPSLLHGITLKQKRLTN